MHILKDKYSISECPSEMTDAICESYGTINISKTTQLQLMSGLNISLESILSSSN